MKNVELGTQEYWNDVYSGKDKAKVKAQRGGHENERFEVVAKHIEGPVVLDVASGYAALPKYLKTHRPDLMVTAVDFSKEAIQRSGWRPYYLLDVCREIPWPEKFFDSIVCCQGLGYMASPDQFLRNAQRAAKKLIVTVSDADRAPHVHQHEFTLESLRALLSSYGTIEVVFATDSIMLFAKVDFGREIL